MFNLTEVCDRMNMMDVHNIMEEIVYARVNTLYEQVKSFKPAWLTCDCLNCRLDTISYVLNRIPPKYIVSGRGLTHSTDTLDDSQLKADIDALGMEGIRLVSSTKRPYHDTNPNDCRVSPPVGPRFNFPTFMGSVLDGSTFEPLAGAKILLKYNGQPATMVDATWANPCVTYKSTHGDYTFWVNPVTTEKNNINEKFPFTLEISAPGYNDSTYSFVIPLTSESVDRSQLDSTNSFKIKDLFLFKTNIQNPME